MKKRVVIVGGGLAGLAAAEALSARKFPVTLLESRPRLGGRASSFEDKVTGQLIDNCQHVSLGCCTNFRHFCQRAGIADAFRPETSLTFIDGPGRISRFAARRRPAPLHLVHAFRRLRFLSLGDKLAIARGLSALAKANPRTLEPESFDVWLARHQQTENAVNRFWNVVIVSALSESLERVSTAHARKVFVDSFLRNPQGWTVQVPVQPLEELYGSRMRRHLESQGVELRISTGVRRLLGGEPGIAAAELRDGELVSGDEFILAVPHHLVRPMLPDTDQTICETFDRLEAAPISSVHLWFDRPITDLPHAVFVDRLSQWIFNRTALHTSESPESVASPSGSLSPGVPIAGGHYYQVVISASREIGGTPSDEAIAAVVEELRDVFPGAKEATLLHSRMVTEHRAVFSVLPGSDANRPRQQSPLANLQFSGDWTRTGWPATMEGAVRSGYLAAENVLNRCGRRERLVRADLPAGRLVRWMFGDALDGPGS